MINNAIILTTDNGISFQIFKTDFKPEYVHFMNDIHALIAYDETNKKVIKKKFPHNIYLLLIFVLKKKIKKIWISKDFLKSWQLVSDHCLKMTTK